MRPDAGTSMGTRYTRTHVSWLLAGTAIFVEHSPLSAVLSITLPHAHDPMLIEGRPAHLSTI